MASKVFELEFVDPNGVRHTDVRVGMGLLASRFGERFKKAVTPAAKDAMQSMLDQIELELQARHALPYSGQSRPEGPGLPQGDRSGRLQRRSGLLLRSLTRSIRVRLQGEDEVEGQIGIAGQRAIQEFGGTTRPTRSKYMAIPLPAALNSRGQRRAAPRRWRNTFVARSAKGNLIIFQKRRGDEIVPLFLLKLRVKVPARFGLRSTLDRHASRYIDRLAELIDERVLNQPGVI